MASSKEINDFKLARARALQELGGYVGTRVKIWVNTGTKYYNSSTFHKNREFYTTNKTDNCRNKALTRARVKNIIDVEETINKITIDKNTNINTAYQELSDALNDGLVKNKNIATDHGKQHTSIRDGIEKKGSILLGFFSRTFFQANSDTAFYNAIDLVDVAANKAQTNKLTCA